MHQPEFSIMLTGSSTRVCVCVQIRPPHLPPFFPFLGPLLWHMEVPRLGIESELQLPAYTTATAMLNLSCPTPQLTATLGSLTHSVRPGIEPTSSWILVGFGNSVLSISTVQHGDPVTHTCADHHPINIKRSVRSY